MRFFEEAKGLQSALQPLKRYTTTRRRLKDFAKEALQSRLWPSIFACLIPGLITWGLRLFPSDLLVVHLLLFDHFLIGVSLFMTAASVVVSAFATWPLEAGLASYFTQLLSGGEKPPSVLSVCDCFGAGYVRIAASMFAYKAVAFAAAAVPLAMLLLPGIITIETIGEIEAYRVSSAAWLVALLSMTAYLYVETALSMVPYLIMNGQAQSMRESLQKSFQMTRSRVGELIVMQLSFLLWLSVVALTVFIGMLYVYPYIEATYAAYYLELSGAGRRASAEEPAREN